MLSAWLGSVRRAQPLNARAKRQLREAFELHQRGDYASSAPLLRSVLRADPQNADANYLLGRQAGERGRAAEARAYLEAALAARRDFAEAHAALGLVAFQDGELARARICFERALELDPRDVPSHYHLGLVLRSQQATARSVEHFRAALDLSPRFTDALRAWVFGMMELDRGAETLEAIRSLLAGHPDYAEAHECAGFALLKLLRPEESLEHYRRARALGRETSEMMANVAVALQDLARIDEAIAAYDRALELEPGNRHARWHRALTFLLAGDFARGWRDYELRESDEKHWRSFPQPRWQGEDLAGRTILVHAEQGLGDEIMFGSCLPELLHRAGHCVIDCAEKLGPLFRRSFPQATVHAGWQVHDLSWLADMPPIDVQIGIAGLPQFFRRQAADFPRHAGYLRADAARVAHWHSRLEELGPGMKLGISWRGGMRTSRRPLRSMDLSRLERLFLLPGCHWVDLQYDSTPAEIESYRAASGIRIHHWSEALGDYDGTAALVCALDLVVSVCTSIVHLGGALGRPVWVMAPHVPEWRYGLSGDTMPWYPSVRIFRQPTRGDWDSVIDAVARALRAATPVI